MTFLKVLSGREPTFQILLASNAGGTLIASIAMIWLWQTPTDGQWIMVLAIGPLMLLAQLFYVTALRMGEASFVIPFSYATLLFAAFYDLVLFDTVPVPLSILGGVIIAVCGIGLAWSEKRH